MCADARMTRGVAVCVAVCVEVFVAVIVAVSVPACVAVSVAVSVAVCFTVCFTVCVTVWYVRIIGGENVCISMTFFYYVKMNPWKKMYI